MSADKEEESKKDSLSSRKEQYEIERSKVSAKIKVLASYFREIVDIANNQHEFYEYRHELVALKLRHMTESNIQNRNLIGAKRTAYDNFKFGNVKNTRAPGGAVVPKNEMERELYLDDAVKSQTLLVNLIDNQITFFKDSIASLDSMTFNLKLAMELEKYKAPNL